MYKCICKDDETQHTTTDNAESKKLDNLFYFSKKSTVDWISCLPQIHVLK